MQGARTDLCEIEGVMQPTWLWLGVLPVCGAAAWGVLHRPIRKLVEARDARRARALFRLQREALEMRFLLALVADDPLESERWDDAEWLDEVIWARERQSRRLLALVGVRFDLGHFGDGTLEHATALFEYVDGSWEARGRHLDSLRPKEAFLRHRQLEPIEPDRGVY